LGWLLAHFPLFGAWLSLGQPMDHGIADGIQKSREKMSQFCPSARRMSHPYIPVTNPRPSNMKLTSICWLPIASPDYLADVLARGSDAPMVRKHKNLNHEGGKPEFIVLSFKEIVRGFDSGKKDSNATVVEMVVMDGSYTCIVARLNSGVVHKLRKNELYPGFGIRVLDHHFIWHWNSRINHWNGILFISDFEWTQAPTVNTYRYKESKKPTLLLRRIFKRTGLIWMPSNMSRKPVLLYHSITRWRIMVRASEKGTHQSVPFF
jgi:hypothetical protein